MTERRLNHEPERIRRRRIAAGLSLTKLALAAGIAKSHLSNIEHGEVNASPEVLGRIAEVLDCQIADLMPPAAEEAKSA